MSITFKSTELPDGRIRVTWETAVPREWQRALELLKNGIPQNGRIFEKETKSWVIAGQYRHVFENIRAAFEAEDEEVFSAIDERLEDEVIAQLVRVNLTTLPETMRRRANFAIKAALGLIDAPVQFCVSEQLFGAWYEVQGCWVYENGKYSASSPTEKDQKAIRKAHSRLQTALESMGDALERLDQEDPAALKAKFRARMLKSYDYRCYTCKRKPDDLRHLHMHRVTPGRDGGMYTEDNVVILCSRCHKLLEGETWDVIHSHAKEGEVSNE